MRDHEQGDRHGGDADHDADEGVGEPQDRLLPGVAGLPAARSMTTVVEIAAVIESPGRPASVVTRTVRAIRRPRAALDRAASQISARPGRLT